MGQGNAKLYLNRLDHITKWCTLRQSMEGANANFWPSETQGTDRIIASAAVTIQAFAKERSTYERGQQKHWLKCMPLLHPSIVVYLEGRALPEAKLLVPSDEALSRNTQEVDMSPDGTPHTPRPSPLTVTCTGLNGKQDWTEQMDIIVRNEGSIPGYGPVLRHQDAVRSWDTAGWPAATEHEYGIQLLLTHEGSAKRWNKLMTNCGMQTAAIQAALTPPSGYVTPVAAHLFHPDPIHGLAIKIDIPKPQLSPAHSSRGFLSRLLHGYVHGKDFGRMGRVWT